LVSLVAIALVSSLNTVFIVSFSRVVQCAVLAGMAMAYLEQRMSEAPAQPATQDPIWLLSLGQLVYSAGTVTAFSLDQLSVTIYDQSWKYIVVALIGMVFNYFLTLAFLRAKPQAAAPPVAGTPVQLAAS
jgi:hypothetical protein